MDEFAPIFEQYLNSLCGKWEEISAEQYEDMLEILPPVDWHGGGFFFFERYTANVSHFYQKQRGRYFTSYQRLNTARATIIASLEAFIAQSSEKSQE